MAREISFRVAGYPPAKNEAKSMLASGHIYADRVLVLLRAGEEAVPRAIHRSVHGLGSRGLPPAPGLS